VYVIINILTPAQLDMLVDYSKLNAVFDIDGPYLLEVEDEPIRPVRISIGGHTGFRHTEEAKKKCGRGKQHFVGENNPNAQTYIFTDPEGLDHIVVGRLHAFCQENSISRHTMKAALEYGRQGPRRNGWSIRRHQ